MMYNNFFASELPAAVRAFVVNSFPKQSIAFAEKNASSTGISFLVSLNDGTELSFSSTGTCTNIYRKYEDYSPILL